MFIKDSAFSREEFENLLKNDDKALSASYVHKLKGSCGTLGCELLYDQCVKVEGHSFPSPGDLPDPGIEPRSPALQADSLLSEPPGRDETKSLRYSYRKDWYCKTVEENIR